MSCIIYSGNEATATVLHRTNCKNMFAIPSQSVTDSRSQRAAYSEPRGGQRAPKQPARQPQAIPPTPPFRQTTPNQTYTSS